MLLRGISCAGIAWPLPVSSSRVGSKSHKADYDEQWYAITLFAATLWRHCERQWLCRTRWGVSRGHQSDARRHTTNTPTLLQEATIATPTTHEKVTSFKFFFFLKKKKLTWRGTMRWKLLHSITINTGYGARSRNYLSSLLARQRIKFRHSQCCIYNIELSQLVLVGYFTFKQCWICGTRISVSVSSQVNDIR